jgi:hypothetical protein
LGCACKDKSKLTPDSRNLLRAYPGPGDEGVVSLRYAPDCTSPYDGIYRQATVFVVGYDTEHEQLFKRGDRTAALKMARDNRLSFDQVTARSLCHEVVLELLGA